MVTWNQFVQVFVTEYSGESNRHRLFAEFERYNRRFQAEITSSYAQWIGGSFVSKHHNPRDIDFVTILDASIYEANADIINEQFSSKVLKAGKGLDAYFLTKFAPNHPKYIIYRSDSLYWENLFSKTRRNRAKKQFARGFIEIRYDNYQL